jgi:outer membrane protein assembly factor BamB
MKTKVMIKAIRRENKSYEEFYTKEGNRKYLKRFLQIIFCISITTILIGCDAVGGLLSPPKLKIEGARVYATSSTNSDIIVPNSTATASAVKVSAQSPHSNYEDLARSSTNMSGNIAFSWTTQNNNVAQEQNNEKDSKGKNNAINETVTKKIHSTKFNNYATNYNFPLASMPIITPQEKMVILDTAGTLQVFDMKTGKKVWLNNKLLTKPERTISKYLHRYFSSGGMMFDDKTQTLFVTNGTDHVVAASINDGHQIWSTQLSSIIRTVPLLMQKDKLIIQGDNNKIYALDAKNGNVLWCIMGILEDDAVQTSMASSPVAWGDDHIILQNTHGEILAINVSDGGISWKLEPLDFDNFIKTDDVIVNYTPFIEDDMLYVISDTAKISGISLKTNMIVWQQNINLRQPFWITGNMIYAVNDNGKLVAIQKESGMIHWVVDLAKSYPRKRKMDKEINPLNMFSSPVVMGDVVCVVSYDGVLLGYDPTSGEKIHAIDIHNRSSLPPLIYDNAFFIFSKDGTITKYFSK